MSITPITTAVTAFNQSTGGRIAIGTGKALGWTMLAIKANSEASRNFLQVATTVDTLLKAKTEEVRHNWQNRLNVEDVA